MQHPGAVKNWCSVGMLRLPRDPSELEPYLTPHSGISWLESCVWKAESQAWEVNAEEKLHAVGIGNILSSLTLKENIEVFDYSKIQNFCSSKTSFREDKCKPQNRKLHLKKERAYIQNLKQPPRNNKKNWWTTEKSKRHKYLTEEDIQMPNKHVKK